MNSRKPHASHRNTRSLYILLIVAVAVVTVGAVAAICLIGFSGKGGKETSSQSGETYSEVPSEKDLQSGVANVVDYGATPNDGTDDTAAFRKAASTGLSVFVPPGTYTVSDTININGGFIAGSSMADTVLLCTGQNTILRLQNGAGATQLTLGFAETTGGEALGERTAIEIGAAGSGQTGSYVKSVRIDTVGTGIYSDAEGVANGEAYENILVSRFVSAGICLKTTERRNTSFRSVTLGDSQGAQAGLLLANDENTLIEQLLLENLSLTEGVRFTDSVGLSLRTAAFSKLSAADLIVLDNAVGSFGSLYDAASEGNILKLANFRSETVLPVDFVHAESIGSSQTFHFVRAEGLKAPCTVEVAVCSGGDPAESHHPFPYDEDANLTVHITK